MTSQENSVWCPPFAPGQKVAIESLANELLVQIMGHCSLHGARALLSLSLVSRLFRAVCLPKLFRVLRVRSREHLLHTTLAQVAASTHILPVVRAISIQPVSTPESLFSEKSFSCHESCPAVLLQLLKAIPSLVKVRFGYHEDRTAFLALLRAHVLSHKVSVPSVKSLKVTMPTSVAFMLAKQFPNLTTVNIQLTTKTFGLGALQSLAHLKALSLDREGMGTGWCVEDIERLVELAPNVQYLVLNGELGDTPVSSLVDSFAEFSRLEYLSIPCHQVVYPEPFLFDDGLLNEIDYLKENHPMNEDHELNATSFFIACPNLEHLILYEHFDDPCSFVPGIDEDDQFVAVDVLCLYDSPEEHEASDDYWDGQLPAAF